MMEIIELIIALVFCVIFYAIGSAILSALGIILFGSFFRVLFMPVLVGFLAVAIPLVLCFYLFGTVFMFLLKCLPYIAIIFLIIFIYKKFKK